MTMVKLPNLDLQEVARIVAALEYYITALPASRSAEAPEYQRLSEMLRRSAQIKGPVSPYCAPEAISRS
jgi:hypothetical protein